MEQVEHLNLPHLLLDVGNTKIGAAIFLDGKMLSTFRSIHKGATSSSHWQHELIDYLRPYSSLQHALIASVVPSLNDCLIACLKRLKLHVRFVEEIPCSIKTSCQHVGADRLADIYGMRERYLGNCISISLGTALVFNVIKNAQFCGGAIAPGFGIASLALANTCALLSTLDPYEIKRPSVVCGKDTVSNIQSGIYYGTLGMIEKIIKELKNECFNHESIKVIMTGGVFADHSPSSLGNQLKEDLKHIVDGFDEHLTLIGLNAMYKENRHLFLGKNT